MFKKPLRNLVSIVALALPIISVDTQSVLAGDSTYQVFTINNNSGRDIAAIYMSPEDDGSWRGEILQDRILQNGQSFQVKLRLSRTCTRNRDFIYDLRVEVINGPTMSQTVNVCDGSIDLGGNVATRPNSAWNQQGPVSGNPYGNPYGNPNAPGNPYGNPNAPGNPYGNPNATGNPYGNPNATGNPYGNPNVPVVPAPTVLITYNPNQPVSPAVMARINAAFASQGLQPASCSASPVAVFNVNNQYTACAYPSASYPTGNYRLDIPGL